ncbi:MAG TPA: fibronectin type III domain-containing protein [Terriglobales bacterium]|nr:fibronectin type III domain-containing protein [Terriglobales bacterium]
MSARCSGAGASRPRAARGCWLAGAALLLAGCAQVGPPAPPSANLPAAPVAFVLMRAGNALQLSWRSSARTSDGAGQRGFIRPVLCLWPTSRPRVPVPPNVPCPRQVPIGSAGRPGSEGAESVPLQRLRLELPGAGNAEPAVVAPFMYVALAFANANRQVGTWSPFVLAPWTPAPPPPPPPHAVITPEGVRLEWPALAPPPPLLRLYRSQAAPEPLPAQPLADLLGSATTYLDTGIVWNARYSYTLRAVAGAGQAEVESLPSPAVTIVAANRFPPPAPAELRAVLAPGPGPAAVDLSWLPVTAPRLAGYNVYRTAAGAEQWQRLNAVLLPTPIFRDAGVSPGTYQYAATAVDEDGNESPRSAPVAITIH